MEKEAAVCALLDCPQRRRHRVRSGKGSETGKAEEHLQYGKKFGPSVCVCVCVYVYVRSIYRRSIKTRCHTIDWTKKQTPDGDIVRNTATSTTQTRQFGTVRSEPETGPYCFYWYHLTLTISMYMLMQCLFSSVYVYTRTYWRIPES